MSRPDRSTNNATKGGKTKKGKAQQGAASDRQARVAQIQKQAKSASRKSASGIWIGLGLVLVLIGGLVGWAVYDQATNRPGMGAVVTYDELDDPSDDLGRNHVQTAVQYQQSPPVGGDHNSTWLNCGIYEEPVPNHHAVHSLEHGAVWLSYQPGIAEDDLNQLRDLASQEFMILSPNEGQEHPIMATAWGRQLGVENADDTRIEQFIRDWRQGPQTPEPGAACTGGTSVDLVGG
ncbi:DUF3105 domain-containing protein [Ornithinimicrobium sp. F0845]|uniref:DUF3105 domain-containing protein n=1 Tax=Ornithinimicrobium sp. F0845 TaxID=2926412 RepID=UPI001FF548ED|nr:DUF3105 domain-containing protein [Ornithinimicrobium sp. F0845]MCK0113648.1 DUF3105 domain-containing protein [Ornithinimicrobium sp. F0845]